MMTPFRFFAGGPMGSGRQYMSWIHRLDWIEMVRWIVQTPEATARSTSPRRTRSPTASSHARSAAPCSAPRSFPAPAFALSSVLGEFANSILTGQRVVPAHARSSAYHFRYPEIDIAVQRNLRGLSSVGSPMLKCFVLPKQAGVGPSCQSFIQNSGS